MYVALFLVVDYVFFFSSFLRLSTQQERKNSIRIITITPECEYKPTLRGIGCLLYARLSEVNNFSLFFFCQPGTTISAQVKCVERVETTIYTRINGLSFFHKTVHLELFVVVKQIQLSYAVTFVPFQHFSAIVTIISLGIFPFKNWNRRK